MYWDKYLMPRSLEEALSMLVYYGGSARVVAGGTDLMLQVQEGKHQVKALVDISGLADLKQVREDGDYLRVGALCTHSQIAGSSLVLAKVPALAGAAASVGSPQIRNVGTLGGNVVNAQPAADTSIALTALEAGAVVVSARGREIRPLGDLFAGVGRSSVDPTAEIIAEFLIPLPAGQAGSSFQRLSRRKALTLPVLNAAVAVELDSQLKNFQRARIAVGPVAHVPWRAMEAEELLAGAPVSNSAIREAGLEASEKARPRDSLRGGAEYRKQMVRVLVCRALKDAVERLGGVVNG